MSTLDPDRPDLDCGLIPNRIQDAELLRVHELNTRHYVRDNRPVSGDLLALYWRHGITEVGE